jgi:hypothetical protein
MFASDINDDDCIYTDEYANYADEYGTNETGNIWMW